MYRLISVLTGNFKYYKDQLKSCAYSNSVVPIGLELGYVCSSDTVGLNPVDINDEVLMGVNCPKASTG